MGLEIKEYNTEINSGDYVFLRYDFIDRDRDVATEGIYIASAVDSQSLLLLDPITKDVFVLVPTDQIEEYLEKILEFVVVTDNNSSSRNDVNSVGIILAKDLDVINSIPRVITHETRYRGNACHSLQEDIRTATREEVRKCIDYWNEGETYHVDVKTEEIKDKDIEFKREFKRRYGAGAVICYVDDDYNIITETI